MLRGHCSGCYLKFTMRSSTVLSTLCPIFSDAVRACRAALAGEKCTYTSHISFVVIDVRIAQPSCVSHSHCGRRLQVQHSATMLPPPRRTIAQSDYPLTSPNASMYSSNDRTKFYKEKESISQQKIQSNEREKNEINSTITQRGMRVLGSLLGLRSS